MRTDSTDSEWLLWWALRRQQLGVRFRRQHPIERFIVDFVCLSHRLIVEIDGSQHAGDIDSDRDAILARAGFMVMRFWSWDVLRNINWVVRCIRSELVGRDRHPPPNDLRSFDSPARGE